MRKWIILLVLIIIAIIGYNYIYQDHRDVKTEKAEHVLASKKFISEFESDASIAESTYLNKTVELTGNISQIDSLSVTLEDKVFCQLDNKFVESLTLGHKVRIKGRFIGYDDLLEQIKLDQCTIIN